MLLLAALDVGRFGWSAPMPAWVTLIGALLFLAGQVLFIWAKVVNRFFSSVVRIQTDRGHRVCSDGPYRYVRHPGYAAGLTFGVATPLVLGSWWALLPAILAAGLLIWRTDREDQFLQRELPGYAEFTHTTRYRLLPGVW
jgi:protein-S-isoprenylcysteine O-methyltransferase Ste14